ncbi:hypothetical protein [Marinactinospora rubrisoli]|uniref:Uncharacterized protein n=1 Tax=Marinactinospora rubrisoli TaxID=2715399 RepID=A0ABW2KMZ8_9ACTN
MFGTRALAAAGTTVAALLGAAGPAGAVDDVGGTAILNDLDLVEDLNISIPVCLVIPVHIAFDSLSRPDRLLEECVRSGVTEF